MQIFLLTKSGKRSLSLTLNLRVIGPVLASVTLGLVSLGYFLGHGHSETGPLNELESLQSALHEQQQMLEHVQLRSENTLDGLAIKLGQLQSHMLRLNAVGQNLAKRAKLDPSEFNFDETPAVGGVEEQDANPSVATENEILSEIAVLESALAVREQQLKMLDQVLMNNNVSVESKPAGRPIENGWLSSYFGRRTDPFTGRRAWHQGVDFAGKLGSPVVAVASGLVTWVGERSGYGKLVEIDHGNGYVTRYGHNSEILVKQGDFVESEQIVSKMGSTGRSTGPHVHFEVLRNGKAVDPITYIRQVRKPIL